MIDLFYRQIKNIQACMAAYGLRGLGFFPHVHAILSNSMDNLLNYTNTTSTVIAAVVVLYYTMQDSHRVGIPHRTVVAYFVGSWAVPSLFGFECMGVVFLQFRDCIGRYVFNGAVASVILLQLAIILIIVLTSSSEFTSFLIRQAEFRQLKYSLQYDVSGKRYIWNYFIRHMGQAICGEDMISDKARLIRKLLEVPLYYKKRILKRQEKDCEEEEWSALLYEYYFMGLIMAFEAVKGKPEEIHQVFSALYEFADYCADGYHCGGTESREDEAKGQKAGWKMKISERDYVLVLSALLNAALSSELGKADDFCQNMINQRIRPNDQKIRNCVLVLFILYMEFLNRTEGGRKIEFPFERIERLRSFEYEDNEIYSFGWFLWQELTNLPLQSSAQVWDRVHAALRQTGYSDIVSYFYYIIDTEEETENAFEENSTVQQYL